MQHLSPVASEILGCQMVISIGLTLIASKSLLISSSKSFIISHHVWSQLDDLYVIPLHGKIHCVILLGYIPYYVGIINIQVTFTYFQTLLNVVKEIDTQQEVII